MEHSGWTSSDKSIANNVSKITSLIPLAIEALNKIRGSVFD
jgi:hypothetical protein